MVELTPQEKEKIDQTEQEEKRRKHIGWFNKVAPIYKILAVIILFWKYMIIVNAKGDMKEMIVWVLAALFILWILGQEFKREPTHLPTPEEAENALKKEILRKIKDKQIEPFTDIYIGPNNGLKYNEGIPQYYLIQWQQKTDSYHKYHQAMVYTQDPQRLYVTMQESMGNIRGTESIPVVSPFPPWMQRSRKHDLGFEKLLWGKENKPPYI